jgi:hypothetical protein
LVCHSSCSSSSHSRLVGLQGRGPCSKVCGTQHSRAGQHGNSSSSSSCCLWRRSRHGSSCSSSSRPCHLGSPVVS